MVNALSYKSSGLSGPGLVVANIFIAAIIASPVQSQAADKQTQADIRRSVKWEIAVQPAMPARQLLIAYHFSEKIYFGLSLWHTQDSYEYRLDSWFMLEIRIKYAQPRGNFFVNFFPFDSAPLYIAGHIGQWEGYASESKMLYSFIPGLPYSETVSFTQSPDPFAAIGAGFRYYWSSGAFIGFEYNSGYLQKSRPKKYTYIDSRALLSHPARNPLQLYLDDWLDNNLGAGTETARLEFIQLHFGVSF